MYKIFMTNISSPYRKTDMGSKVKIVGHLVSQLTMKLDEL